MNIQNKKKRDSSTFDNSKRIELSFLIPAHIPGSGHIFSHIPVKTMQEANEKLPNAIDKNTFDYLNLLCKSAAFVFMVKEIRKDLGIPIEGYTYDNKAEYKKLHQKIDVCVIHTLWPIFRLPSRLKHCLHGIIFANYVVLPLNPIFIEHGIISASTLRNDTVSIIIQGKISKNTLSLFIERNWKLLQNKMEQFDDEETIRLPEETELIMYLRDTLNWKFSKIADKLADYHKDGRFNEDMVKRKYHLGRKQLSKIVKTNPK